MRVELNLNYVQSVSYDKRKKMKFRIDFKDCMIHTAGIPNAYEEWLEYPDIETAIKHCNEHDLAYPTKCLWEISTAILAICARIDYGKLVEVFVHHEQDYRMNVHEYPELKSFNSKIESFKWLLKMNDSLRYCNGEYYKFYIKKVQEEYEAWINGLTEAEWYDAKGGVSLNDTF